MTGGKLSVNGSQTSPIDVTGGTLGGVGTLGALNVTGGTLQPGLAAELRRSDVRRRATC